MTAINGMFTENTNGAESTNSRSLTGTAQLTNLATTLANKAMSWLNDGLSSTEEKDGRPVADAYTNIFQRSKTDHSDMDRLIELSGVLNHTDDDVEFLKGLDEATIEGMLKSQQSKRSRAKSKTMTKDNYLSMLTGAIAENLIRVATGKEKQATRRTAGEVSYTQEALDKLAGDQDALRKELRNIQSKKSIMKSKEGFSEDSDGWKSLLAAEEALKNIRVAGAGGATKTIEVDTTKKELTAIFNGFAPEELDISDAKVFNRKKLAEIIEGWQAVFGAIKALTLVTEPAADETTPDDNSGDEPTKPKDYVDGADDHDPAERNDG